MVGAGGHFTLQLMARTTINFPWVRTFERKRNRQYTAEIVPFDSLYPNFPNWAGGFGIYIAIYLEIS